MDSVHTTTYEQLTDAEWSKIRHVVLMAVPHDDTPRVGRKRVDPRPVTNAVLHHITTGLGLGHVGSNVVDYPSAPTRRRFLKALADGGVLAQLFALLEDTRPMLRKQFDCYDTTRSKYITKELLTREQKKLPSETGLAWGSNVAHLPWGKVPVLEND